MAEITAPIVTITLVLAAVFVPVAFIPGLTGRLYNQFAMTIVFSFLFSAINSLTFSPAMARLFLRAQPRRVEVLPVPLVQPRACDGSRTRTTRSSSSRRTTGGRSSIPSLALLALTGYMLVERPKAFIPIEDQGYLIVAIQTPDGTGREPDVADRAAGQQPGAEDLEGSATSCCWTGFNVLNSTNQTNSATAFVILKEWSERTEPALRAAALTQEAPGDALRARSAAPWRWCSSRRRSAG